MSGGGFAEMPESSSKMRGDGVRGVTALADDRTESF